MLILYGYCQKYESFGDRSAEQPMAETLFSSFRSVVGEIRNKLLFIQTGLFFTKSTISFIANSNTT